MSDHPARAKRQFGTYKQFPRDTGYVESQEEGWARMEAAMPNPTAPIDADEPRILATFEDDHQ
jgi:hypothetical protein